MAMKPLPPWEVLSTREVFKDRWVDLRAERCRTAAGAIIEPYYVQHRHDWACIFALDQDDHVVLVRVWRQGTRAESIELPAGAIDPGEAPLAAAERELLEETGYRCSRVEAVAKLATNPANMTSYVHVYLARGAERVAAPALEAGETLETMRVPLADLKAMALSGGITHAVHVAAILLALDRLEKA